MKNKYLPSVYADYYKDMNAKHFGVKTTGSRFTEVKSIEELLELAGDCVGDDRVHLAHLGVSEKALMKDCRYILVRTPGYVGIVKAKELSPVKEVYVERKKEGCPCSLVVKDLRYQLTSIATIIIGPNDKGEGEMVYTAHPGLPIEPATEDPFEEGSVVSVQMVIDKFGEDAYLQIG